MRMTNWPFIILSWVQYLHAWIYILSGECLMFALLEAAVLFSTFRIRIKRKTGQKWCLTFFRSFWTDASSRFYLWQKFTLLRNCYQNSPQLLHKFKRINLYSLRNHQKTLGFFDDFRGIWRQLIRLKAQWQIWDIL